MCESTQLGAELIGDGTAGADAELIALAADSLKRAGMKEFQISVGHVEFRKAFWMRHNSLPKSKKRCGR